MNSKNGEFLGKLDVRKLLVKLSVPAILGMSVNALYNFVDTIFVAKSQGNIATGALGIAFPIHMIIVAFALMIGVGGASVFSRAYGRGDRETMTNVVNTALRIDFILALLIMIFGVIYIDELLILFGATSTNLGFAQEYLGIILLGIIPMSMQMVLNNFARAEGRAKIAMFSMMLGAGLNIILDPIFIFDYGLGLGVQGAAIATVISQVVGFTFIFSMSLSSKSILRINLKNWFDIHLGTVKEIIAIGGPTFIRNSIVAMLVVLVHHLINNYATGDPALVLSMYSIINRVFLVIFLPAFGIVQGLVPIVGYNFGAEQYKRIKDVIIYATKIIVLYLFLGFVFVQFFSEFVFDIFSKDSDPFFINTGSNIFRIISIGYIMVGFNIILSSVYQALGYPKRAFLVAISRQLILFTPIVFILTPIFGVDGIWYTFAISDTLAGTLGLLLLIYELRALNKLYQTKNSSK